MFLTDDVIRNMAPGKFYHRENNGAAINSLDFHRTHDLLVTAADDDCVSLYNVQSGELMKMLYVKKFGASSICFTHSPTCVLAASGKKQAAHMNAEHDVRYHSFHDNAYLRFFKGHTDRVSSVAMSPKTDEFLSASDDKTVRFWDLRTNVCAGVLRCGPAPCVTYDHQGLVLAASTDSGVVKLYDSRKYDQGPFDTFAVGPPPGPPIASLRFSLDGKQLLAVGGGFVYVLDAYNGARREAFPIFRERGLHVFQPVLSTDNVSDVREQPEAAVSPDGQYILAGGADDTIHVWSTISGQEVTRWRGHAGAPLALKWAPTRCLVASGCQAGGLALWIPPPPGAAAAAGAGPAG